MKNNVLENYDPGFLYVLSLLKDHRLLRRSPGLLFAAEQLN